MKMLTHQDVEGQSPCKCPAIRGKTKRIVLTGGPGAGKTAVLETARKMFCRHVVFTPESASIIFNGGFLRLPSPSAKRAAQNAIFHVQDSIENLVINEKRWSLALCDRGTLDGLAYWKGSEASFFKTFQTNLKKEYERYELVIHLRSPGLEMGYNRSNPLRIETPEEAAAIDRKIHAVWKNHKNYVQIASRKNFLDKVFVAVNHIEKYL